MVFIVFIGTPKDAPPGKNNKEKIVIHKINSNDISNIRIGYLHSNIFENIFIKNFYARAAFVFPSYPINIDEINVIEDDMNSIYPYRKTYDEIIAIFKEKKHHRYASWFIKKQYK